MALSLNKRTAGQHKRGHPGDETRPVCRWYSLFSEHREIATGDRNIDRVPAVDRNVTAELLSRVNPVTFPA